MATDQAKAFAIKAASNSRLVRAPELVNYQGTAAYEVSLTGGMVYVDANTAKVLYNGTLIAHGAMQRCGEHEHGAEHGIFFGLNREHDDD